MEDEHEETVVDDALQSIGASNHFLLSASITLSKLPRGSTCLIPTEDL